MKDLSNLSMNYTILTMKEGTDMNPWKSKEWMDFYSNKPFVRNALRMHYGKEIDRKVKLFFYDFSKWLRKNYAFPIRVNVYVKNSCYIKSIDGEHISATFFGPFDRLVEPYIKIAVGDYYDLIKKYDEFNALCSCIASLAHELTHYFQWINDFRLTQDQEERQAKNYAKKIVYAYLNECGYDYLDSLL